MTAPAWCPALCIWGVIGKLLPSHFWFVLGEKTENGNMTGNTGKNPDEPEDSKAKNESINEDTNAKCGAHKREDQIFS